MDNLFLVGLGAAPGALLRWMIQNDLLVNLIGSAVLGLIMGLNIAYKYQLIFGIGFCGAFTTFSGFALKAIQLLNNGFLKEACFLILLTLSLGMLCLFAGFWIGKQLRHKSCLDRHKM